MPDLHTFQEETVLDLCINSPDLKFCNQFNLVFYDRCRSTLLTVEGRPLVWPRYLDLRKEGFPQRKERFTQATIEGDVYVHSLSRGTCTQIPEVPQGLWQDLRRKSFVVLPGSWQYTRTPQPREPVATQQVVRFKGTTGTR